MVSRTGRFGSVLVAHCAVLYMVASPAHADTAPVSTAPVKPAGTAKNDSGKSPGTQATGSSTPAGVEQITVTSLRTRTNLEHTPAAITAVSSSTLDKDNIVNVQGLNGLVPSLTVTPAAGFENLINIRGVGSSTPENALTTQPGVSFFEDGVYLANSISLDQALFDVNRVEVLRGPQGSLYGQSSTGGVINIVTNQPLLGVTSGSADWGIGNYNLFQERAEVNVPVSSTIAVRMSIQRYDHDGFGESVAQPIAGYGLDDAHSLAGKVAILWAPTDNFKATFTAQWARSVQDGAEQKNILDPNPDPREVDQDFPGQFNLDTDLYHLNLEWTLPFAVARSITGYQHLYNTQSEDSSRLSYALLGSYDDVGEWNTDIDSETEDLSLSSLPGTRLDWTGGVFLMHQRSTQLVAELEGDNQNADLAVPSDVIANPPGNLAYGNYTAISRNSIAPYLQATYHILPQLRLIGGVRYNQDSYDGYSYNFSATGGSGATQHYTTGRTTGNVSLQYDLTRFNMLYGSVTEGYKPGGLNSNNGAVVVGHTFLPEGITSFEVGSKNQFLNQHLTVNLAAFFYDYRNMQYIEEDPVPYEYGIANVPNVHIWGGEAEASYVMMGGRLRFNGQLTLENGEIVGDYKAISVESSNAVYASNSACKYGGQYYSTACWAAVIAGTQNAGGNLPPDMPTVQGDLNVEYRMPIWRGELLSRAEFVYRGSEEARIFNDPTVDHVPAYSVYNLFFSYKPDRSNWTVSLALTNLANIAGVASRYTDPYGTQQTSQQYIPPFQAVGRIAYTF